MKKLVIPERNVFLLIVCCLVICNLSICNAQVNMDPKEVVIAGNKLGLEAITSASANAKLIFDDKITNQIQTRDYSWYMDKNRFR